MSILDDIKKGFEEIKKKIAKLKDPDEELKKAKEKLEKLVNEAVSKGPRSEKAWTELKKMATEFYEEVDPDSWVSDSYVDDREEDLKKMLAKLKKIKEYRAESMKMFEACQKAREDVEQAIKALPD
jgi:chromosome segregation ATPase